MRGRSRPSTAAAVARTSLPGMPPTKYPRIGLPTPMPRAQVLPLQLQLLVEYDDAMAYRTSVNFTHAQDNTHRRSIRVNGADRESRPGSHHVENSCDGYAGSCFSYHLSGWLYGVARYSVGHWRLGRCSCLSLLPMVATHMDALYTMFQRH